MASVDIDTTLCIMLTSTPTLAVNTDPIVRSAYSVLCNHIQNVTDHVHMVCRKTQGFTCS